MEEKRTAMEILQEVSKKLEELAELRDEFLKVEKTRFPEFKVGFTGEKLIDIDADAMMSIFPECDACKTNVIDHYYLRASIGEVKVKAFLIDQSRKCELPAVKALRQEVINEQIEELERKKAELIKGKGEN